MFNEICIGEEMLPIYIYIYIYIQGITKVSTPLTFLLIFTYISSWDNTDKMTL